MAQPLEKIPVPPVHPEAMGEGVGPAFRRGPYSFAQHEKLKSRVFVRNGDAAREKVKLPSLTLKVTLSDRGQPFVIDKKEAEVYAIDGTDKELVFTAAEGHIVVRLFVTGEVVWVWEAEKLSAGLKKVKADRVHRVERSGDAWTTTHHGTLTLKATAFAGNDSWLAVLNENGNVTLFAAQEGGDAIVRGTTVGENYTGLREWEGKLVLVSYWEKESGWVVTGVGDTAEAGAAEKPPEALRWDDLPGEVQAGLDQTLGDFTNDLIHEARAEMKPSWDRDRKETFLSKRGRECWSGARDHLLADAKRFYGLEVHPKLEKDLRQRYIDKFEDAAEWSEYD